MLWLTPLASVSMLFACEVVLAVAQRRRDGIAWRAAGTQRARSLREGWFTALQQHTDAGADHAPS